jgi:hypothetical protein
MWVVVWYTVNAVQVVVVVVCCAGSCVCGGGFVDIGPMWCVGGVCEWLVDGVGGGCMLVGVVGIWGIMIFALVVILRVHLPSLFLGQYGLLVYLTIFSFLILGLSLRYSLRSSYLLYLGYVTPLFVLIGILPLYLCILWRIVRGCI